MNKVILCGRVGKDAELKQVGQSHVATFSLATSEKYKDRDGKPVEKTEWHRCTLWGSRAKNLAKWIGKGRELLVEGSIHYREHDGKYYTDIKVADLHFVGAKGGSSGSSDEPRRAPSSFGSPASPLPPGGNDVAYDMQDDGSPASPLPPGGNDVAYDMQDDDIPF